MILFFLCLKTIGSLGEPSVSESLSEPLPLPVVCNLSPSTFISFKFNIDLLLSANFLKILILSGVNLLYSYIDSISDSLLIGLDVFLR